jgi:hypothetical protein
MLTGGYRRRNGHSFLTGREKIMTNTRTLAALVLAAAATSAAAQAPHGGMGEHGPGGTMEPGMMAGEMKGPGMIGPDMMMAHHMTMGPGLTRMMLIMIDTDGDGTLSLDEVQAVHARVFKAADADVNGRLTLEEIESFVGGGMGPMHQ